MKSPLRQIRDSWDAVPRQTRLVPAWRGETDTEEKIRKRVEHDLYYIENWSILFDLGIILRTIWIAFRGDDAY